MRPIRLTIEGLRSYRQRLEISFEGLGLFAITGRTGAGKSSILEAILLALYHASTFDQRNVKALISDGADDLLVSLQFEVHKERWQVTRTVSRGNRPAVHELRQLNGPLVLDKKAEVDARIVELLGLNCDDFLKTVVLPQGQFQALLQSSPADRAPLLKNLLGLDELDRIVEQFSALREQLSLVLHQAKGARQALPPRPEEELEKASLRLEASRTEEQRLGLQLERTRLLEQERLRLETSLGQLAAQLEQLHQLELPEPEQVEALHAIETALAGQEAELEQASELLSQRRQALEVEPRSELGSWRARWHQLEQWQERLTGLAHEEGQQSEVRLALQGDLAGLAQEIVEAEQRLAALEQSGRQAAERADQARTRLSLATEAAQELVRREEQLLGWQEAHRQRLRVGQDLAEELVALQQRGQLRAEESARARRGLQQAERENLVAALCAAHTEEGCPVCHQPLPADWQAPDAPDLEQTRQSCVELERACHELGSLTQRTVGRIELAQGELEALQAQYQQGQQELARLREAGPGPAEPLEADWRASEAACVQLREDYARTRAQLERGRGVHLERQRALDQLQACVQTRHQEVEQLQARRGHTQAELAVALGLEVYEQGLAGIRLAQLEEQARAAQQERTQLLQELAAWQGRRSHLTQRRQLELEQPRSLLHSRVVALSVLLDALEGSAGAWPLREELSEAVAGLTQRRQRVDQLRQDELIQQQARHAELVSRLGPLSLSQVEEEVARAREQRVLGEQAQLQAGQALERVRQLEQALQPVQRLFDRLEFLLEALGNRRGKGRLSFSQWLLEQRQQELLAIASRTFGEMTANQYGFSAQFQVVDRSSGQARKPNTLSGGECFLASLALALALSELVGRKGGRLEAFFLDEGFGSLSPEALDRALDALEALAQSGRMIGVISHVGLVAERIQRVWQVTRGPQGSSLQDLQPDQRQLAVRVGLEEYDEGRHPLLAGVN